jgi:hypothetical protein
MLLSTIAISDEEEGREDSDKSAGDFGNPSGRNPKTP